MSDLRLLDPTHPADPAFDPDGHQAHRVRTAALRGGLVPAPARGRRRLVMAGAAVAAAVAVAFTVGTSTAPPDARAALVEAATRTGAADSGRVLVTIRGKVPGTGQTVDVRTEIRFQGDDLELVGTEPPRTIRRVGGIAYERVGANGGFRKIGKVDPVTFAVVGQYDDTGLVELVRRARDVEAEQDGGVTTYRATTTAGEVEDAAPTAHGRAQGGVWDRKVRLEVAVADDELIRSVTVRDGALTRTTTYLDLGEPQAIERP